jgi:hypothetical protein
MSTAMRRPGGNWSIARIDKAEHYQTVLYEIDMLRLCYSRLLLPFDGAGDADVWANLEAFLVHYRNLIHFFGTLAKSDTDLTLGNPDQIWSLESGLAAPLPDQKTLDEMRAKGRKLWEKYEDRSKRDDTISRYLHHCTTFRLSPKQWFPVEMMSEISELCGALEKRLPEFDPATKSRPIDRAHFLDGGSLSTHSGTKPST